jgi:hypothetical protein
MNKGERRRTLEVLYKVPTANFASEGLDASQSIHIKPPIYFSTDDIYIIIQLTRKPKGLEGCGYI